MIGQSTTKLRKRLRDGTDNQRARAALMLGARNVGDAEADLFEALGSGNQTVRIAAARALIALDPTRPPEPMLRRLRGTPDQSPAESISAEEMVELGLPPYPGLDCVAIFGPALLSGGESMRALSARLLGESDDCRAVPALIEGLQDSSPLVRNTSIHALGRLGGQEAQAALRQLAADSERATRRRARSALRRARRATGSADQSQHV